jgi:hypothetical protein
MSTCNICGEYYRLTPYNSSECCDDCCVHALEPEYLTLDDQLDIDKIMNPSGRVQPVFYDDTESDGS